MKHWLIGLLAIAACGSGSSECKATRQLALTATRQIVGGAACNDLPMSFSTQLSVENGHWAFSEGTGPTFEASYVDPDGGCFGWAIWDDTSSTYHHYVVHLDKPDETYVNVVRWGPTGCMARYSLR